MSIPGSQLRVNYLALNNAANDIEKFVETMYGHLSDLETRLEGKMADWDGATRAAYRNEKTIWDNAAHNIATLLRGVGKAVNESNDTMMATEQRCASMFVN